MTKLLQRLRDELVRRQYSTVTIRSYIRNAQTWVTRVSTEMRLSCRRER